jgi:hypothetical protein
MTSGELAASLRQVDGQRDKGKHPPNFHFRSKPFLHFHNGPDRTYADVRFGGGFGAGCRGFASCRLCAGHLLVAGSSSGVQTHQFWPSVAKRQSFGDSSLTWAATSMRCACTVSLAEVANAITQGRFQRAPSPGSARRGHKMTAEPSG